MTFYPHEGGRGRGSILFSPRRDDSTKSGYTASGLPRFFESPINPQPMGRANELEASGNFRAAGLEHARHNRKPEAVKCAKRCVQMRHPVDAAAVYLAAGMLDEAVSCTQKCKGKSALEAAGLFMDNWKLGSAVDCASRYVKGKNGNAAAGISIDEKKLLFRIFSANDDINMANKFAPKETI
jgi:hypothetical protein